MYKSYALHNRSSALFVIYDFFLKNTFSNVNYINYVKLNQIILTVVESVMVL